MCCGYVFVCPSVASRRSTITSKHMITQTTSHNSPVPLAFGCERSHRNSDGVTPSGGDTGRWVKICDFQQISHYISFSETVQDTHSYYGRLIGNRMHLIEWCNFQWPTTPKLLSFWHILYRFRYLQNKWRYKLNIW